MGYDTKFRGELKFNKMLSYDQLEKLNGILGEDCRHHPEWGAKYLTYIDYKLSKDLSAIKWNGSEKSYDMVEKINLITRLMREEWLDFKLTGQLLAQGEEIGDVWLLKIMINGMAVDLPIEMNPSSEETVICPNCNHHFKVGKEK